MDSIDRDLLVYALGNGKPRGPTVKVNVKEFLEKAGCSADQEGRANVEAALFRLQGRTIEISAVKQWLGISFAEGM